MGHLKESQGERETYSQQTKKFIDRIIELKHFGSICAASKYVAGDANWIHNYLRQRGLSLWPFINKLKDDKQDLNVYFDNPIDTGNTEKLKGELATTQQKHAVLQAAHKQLRETNALLTKELERARKALHEKEEVLSDLHKEYKTIAGDQQKLMKSFLQAINNLK